MNEVILPLEDLADRIRHAHELATTGLRATLAHAKDAGVLLREAKEKLQHGEWLPWLKDVVGIPSRTAQAYMRIAQRWPELEAKAQRVAHLPMREGLKLLAAPTRNNRLAYLDETDIGERCRKFDEWADSVTDGWESDLALAMQILESPTATLGQLAMALELLQKRGNAIGEVKIRRGAELGRIMNDVEEKYGKEMLEAMLENPVEFEAEVRRLAEEKFGKGCLAAHEEVTHA